MARVKGTADAPVQPHLRAGPGQPGMSRRFSCFPALQQDNKAFSCKHQGQDLLGCVVLSHSSRAGSATHPSRCPTRPSSTTPCRPPPRCRLQSRGAPGELLRSRCARQDDVRRGPPTATSCTAPQACPTPCRAHAAGLHDPGLALGHVPLPHRVPPPPQPERALPAPRCPEEGPACRQQPKPGRPRRSALLQQPAEHPRPPRAESATHPLRRGAAARHRWRLRAEQGGGLVLGRSWQMRWAGPCQCTWRTGPAARPLQARGHAPPCTPGSITACMHRLRHLASGLRALAGRPSCSPWLPPGSWLGAVGPRNPSVAAAAAASAGRFPARCCPRR